MSNGIVSVCGWLILVFAMTVMAGCGNERVPTQGLTAGRTGSDDPLSEAYGTGERDALRVKTDMARGRHWVLGLDRVRVYDTVTKKLIRQIALPSWMVIRAVCDPDLVLDRSGSAFISSNVQAKLWRIDGNSFEVKAQEISLPGREDWEVGFGALAFTASGDLYALSSSTRFLWKIDVAKDSARMIERYHLPLNACALTPQFLNSFERSRKPWTSPSSQQN
jgi:hypothetical protein